MKKISFLFIIMVLLAPFGSWAQTATSTPISASIVVSPTVIDIEAKAREIFDYKLIITNHQTTLANVYVLVNDLTEAGQVEYGSPNDLDKTKSLTRWIEISRGKKEIPPGGSVEVPLKIDVDMNAQPGIYHAVITFSQANGMQEAMQVARDSKQATVLINLAVGENIVEKVEIVKFASLKNLYLNWPAKFRMEIKNLGNRPVAPFGFISIYDRRGKEVGSIGINEDRQAIAANEINQREMEWRSERSFGKYVAKINLEYGEQIKRDLSDTIYFWVLPWQYLAGAAAVIVIFIIFLTMVIFRKTFGHYPHQEINGVINLKSK